MRKGQTSLEYLIILAVIVIIALVAVGALSDAPVLGGSTSDRTQNAYWKSTDVGIDGVRVSTGGSVSAIVRNNLENRVKIHAGNVDGAQMSPLEQQIKAGGTATLTATIGSCTAGDPLNLWFSFNYTDQKTGLGPYNLTGAQKFATTCQ